MRCILIVIMAVTGLPQAAGAQQAVPSLIPPWTPFAVSNPATPDSTSTITAMSAATAEDRSNVSIAAAVERRSVIGAGIGFVVGASATWVVLNTGGSTAPCDRDANQDAMSAGECVGIAVLGGAVGALLGALVARWL